MVTVPDRLRALVTTEVNSQNGTLSVELPDELIDHDAIDPTESYQIALLATTTAPAKTESDQSASNSASQPVRGPPVEEGETRTVTIDTLGDQGDGIARVERGFVLIVSDAQPDDELVVEIESVQSNVAFASIIERLK
jgi:predicted RNA-binding protein with TRAM domain